jgi:hypothetical protein
MRTVSDSRNYHTENFFIDMGYTVICLYISIKVVIVKCPIQIRIANIFNCLGFWVYDHFGLAILRGLHVISAVKTRT